MFKLYMVLAYTFLNYTFLKYVIYIYIYLYIYKRIPLFQLEFYVVQKYPQVNFLLIRAFSSCGHNENMESPPVDTRFCTHDLIKENDWNDPPCTLKIMIELHASICSCITCINSFIAYHKDNLEILMVTTVFPVSELDHRIERYHMIKFARSACVRTYVFHMLGTYITILCN